MYISGNEIEGAKQILHESKSNTHPSQTTILKSRYGLKQISIKTKPNFTVEWLALLLRVRKVSGSFLAPEPAIPTDGCPDLLQSFQDNTGTIP
jgi:hypothetical protein